MQPIQFLTMQMICALTGYSRSSVYRKIKNGTFPPFTKIGARASRLALPIYNIWATVHMPEAVYNSWNSVDTLPSVDKQEDRE